MGRNAPQPSGESLEHRMLLTATMCLLAFGAVMVYSASSAHDAAARRRLRGSLPAQVR